MLLWKIIHSYWNHIWMTVQKHTALGLASPILNNRVAALVSPVSCLTQELIRPDCVPAIPFGEAFTVCAEVPNWALSLLGQVAMGMKELQQQTFDVTSCGFGDWILCYFRLMAALKLPLWADLHFDISWCHFSTSCFRNLKFAIAVW